MVYGRYAMANALHKWKMVPAIQFLKSVYSQLYIHHSILETTDFSPQILVLVYSEPLDFFFLVSYTIYYWFPLLRCLSFFCGNIHSADYPSQVARQITLGGGGGGGRAFAWLAQYVKTLSTTLTTSINWSLKHIQVFQIVMFQTLAR